MFRLKRLPPEREQQLHAFAGCPRFVWNKALALQKERLDQDQWTLSYPALCKLLPTWKQEHPFLRECNSQSLQAALRAVDTAYGRAFNANHPAGFPKFKKKGRTKESFHVPQHFQLDQANSRIKLPKLGWLRYTKSRELEGTPKNVTVSKQGDGHWYVSIQVEMEVEVLPREIDTSVGIDVGVSNFAALSTGEIIPPIRAYRAAEQRLALQQAKLARKQRNSNNWKKQQRKLQKTHFHLSNIRKDHHQKLSTRLSKNHAVLCVEDLKVQRMLEEGSSPLSKGIQDQAWSLFVQFLAYKQAWSGGLLLKVPAPYTSQKCSNCGHVAAGNRRSQAEFECVLCGHKEHADVNASKNIKEAGQALFACSFSKTAGTTLVL